MFGEYFIFLLFLTSRLGFVPLTSSFELQLEDEDGDNDRLRLHLRQLFRIPVNLRPSMFPWNEPVACLRIQPGRVLTAEENCRALIRSPPLRIRTHDLADQKREPYRRAIETNLNSSSNLGCFMHNRVLLKRDEILVSFFKRF